MDSYRSLISPRRRAQEPMVEVGSVHKLRYKFMPRLYSIEHDFNSKKPLFRPNHFFPSAQFGRGWGGGESRWSYNLDTDFPAQSYIHYDNVDPYDNTFWIELRKDVERTYCGDVFCCYERKDYKRWWNTKATSEYNKEYDTQRHGYWNFYFENEGDQTMFVIKHAEITSSKKYRFHPLYGISVGDPRYDVPDDEEVPNAWKV